MKNLRKFETEADVQDWQFSEECVKPNVVLVGGTGVVSYNVNPLSEVMIQHIDGSFYTTDEWSANGFANDQANGVAVFAPNSKFVIAKKKLGVMAWSSDTTNAVAGVMLTSKVATAKTDYAGEANTAIMAKVSPSAAKTCAEYTFPNGKKGYLPALGEWYEADKYKDEVNAAMSLIGGTAIGSHWSSTQYSDSEAWYFSGGGVAYPKNYSFTDIVRAFTTI